MVQLVLTAPPTRAAGAQPAAARAPPTARTALQPARSQQLPARRLVARAEQQQGGAPSAAEASSDDVAAEQLLRRGKGKGGAKGFKQQQQDAAGAASSSAAAGPKVIAPIRDQVYGGGPQTALQRAENTVVSVLATLFFVILAEGVFLAGSGFMPAEADQFAQDVVFPAFTPTLGLFLAISTAYGVWKTRSAPEEGQ